MGLQYTAEDLEFLNKQRAKQYTPVPVTPKRVRAKTARQLEKAARTAAWRAHRERCAQMDDYDVRIANYTKRATSKGLLYTLTKPEFVAIVTSDCVYCGGAGYSVDRIDPKGDYVTCNCQPCCVMCNMMKYTFTHESFVNQVKKIATHHNKIPMRND